MIPAARLIIGDEVSARERVITILQKECNACLACGACAACMRIVERRDWRIIWMDETTKDALDVVLERCSYQSGGVAQYVVLCDVDTFSASAAARLLKDLEEPPAGYHFLLTARTSDRVLPTILSRCHIDRMHEQQRADDQHPWALKLRRDTFSLIAREYGERGVPDDIRIQIDLLQRALCSAYANATGDEQIRLGHALVRVQQIAQIPAMPGTTALLMRALIAALAVA